MNNIIRGLSWSTLSSGLVTLFFFVQYVTLSNSISIYEMGIIGIALMIISLAQLISDAGISNAIIYFDDVRLRLYKSLMLVNILIGIILFTLFQAFSDLIALIFQYNNIDMYMLFISINFLIIPIGQVSYAKLQKELKFDSISKIEILSILSSTIIFFILLILINSLFAFLISQNLYYLFKALLYSYQSKNDFKKASLSFKGSSKYIKYGLNQMIDRLLGFFYQRSEFFLIGIFLGPTYLGMYTFINNIVIQPISRVLPIFNKVFLPHFSLLKSNTNELRNLKIKMMKNVGILVLIIYMLIYSNLAMIINIIDSKYSNAIFMGSMIILLYILRSFNSSGGILAYATGNTSKSIKYNLVKLLSLIPMVIFISFYEDFSVLNLFILLISLQIIMNYLNIKMIIGPVLNSSSLYIINKVKLPYIILVFFSVIIFLTEYFDIRTISTIFLNITSVLIVIIIFIRRNKNESVIDN